MRGGQIDLFDSAGLGHEQPPPLPRNATLPAADLTDEALIAAIPHTSQTTCHTLSGEAARRRLVAAVPALEALCRRFKGFGLRVATPEQPAALQALAAIGGPDATAAVSRIVTAKVVAGPRQPQAVRAAAALRCLLPEASATALLLHADPEFRAQACRCAPRTAPVAALLVSLL